MEDYPEGQSRTKCYERVGQLNQDLKHLLGHSEIDFCKRIGSCPNSGVQLEKLIGLMR